MSGIAKFTPDLRDHPDIARCLRTGYPYIKPVSPVDPSVTVNDDEFAQIVAARKKEAKQNA